MNLVNEILSNLEFEGCSWTEVDGIISVITPEGENWIFNTPQKVDR